MKKLLLLTIAVLFVFLNSNAQQYAKTEKVFSAKTKFDFTNEWQYVSTDLYLFNSHRFNFLINRVSPPEKKGLFRSKKREIIKNILVTAQLDGLGDLDAITYPIFNFVVSEDNNGNWQTQVSEPEVIRIVDNVPVSSLNDYIGAKIKMQVYSDKNRSDLYKFVAEQLQAASSFTSLSATDAALNAVGEIGKMMQKDAAGKQYQFESTIRFYQEKNFDRRFHSITIFVFEPSNSYSSGFDTSDVSEYFDTTKTPFIDKDKLRSIIDYSFYPFIVTVNYISKYKPEISDDINFDMLRNREAKNESNYNNALISRDIYLQEKSLIDFLKIFAQLQLDINNYELDYDAKITEDYTIQLFIILQDYWKLKNSYKISKKAYQGNPLFDNEFEQLYERYLTQANLKFEGNSSLRAIREHVETIYYLENQGLDVLDSLKREDFLRKLKAVNIPPRERNSDEAVVTEHWITELEKEQYSKIYKPKIDKFSVMEVKTTVYNKVQQLRLQSATSYCELCKVNVNSFVENFMAEYSLYLYDLKHKEYRKLVNQTRTKILEYSKKQACIESNIDTSENAGKVPEHTLLILETLNLIESQKLELLQITNNSNRNFSSAKEIENEILQIKNLQNSIESGLKSICITDEHLCNCNEENKNTNKTENKNN